MAKIEKKIFDETTLNSFSDTSEYVDEIKAFIKSAHTFEKEESDGSGGVKLYYTNNSYIRIAVSNLTEYGVNKLYLRVSNDDFTRDLTDVFSVSSWETIKSKNGDVVIRMGSTQVALPQNSYHLCTLFKGKSPITGDELWAVSSPRFAPTTGGNSYDPWYIVTDDTEDRSGANANSGNDGGGNSSYNAGLYNAESKITVLAPLFAVSSEYISQYTYTMRIAPTTYFGSCVLNGQQFYCYGLLAMLDE